MDESENFGLSKTKLLNLSVSLNSLCHQSVKNFASGRNTLALNENDQVNLRYRENALRVMSVKTFEVKKVFYTEKASDISQATWNYSNNLKKLKSNLIVNSFDKQHENKVKNILRPDRSGLERQKFFFIDDSNFDSTSDKSVHNKTFYTDMTPNKAFNKMDRVSNKSIQLNDLQENIVI